VITNKRLSLTQAKQLKQNIMKNTMSKLVRVNKLINEVRNQSNALQTLDTGDIIPDDAFRALLKAMPHVAERVDTLMWRWHALDRMALNLQS